MRKRNPVIVVFIICLMTHFGFGQKSFNNCSAVFLNDKMVVDEYSAKGKSAVSVDAKGFLTVNTVELSETENKVVGSIPFQIAIRDKETGTIWLISTHKTKKIEIHKVLEKCKKGDFIIVLTLNNENALPHNEILVL